jgi:Fe-Mn family superoxide dismutase
MHHFSDVYKPKDYSKLKGLKGITDDQIAEHMKLYHGYCKRTGALLEKTAKMLSDGKTGDSCFQELKRRAGWEFNGMRLHEYYFDNMAPGGNGTLDETNSFGKMIIEQFGGVDAWKDDFMGVGKMPGIGWAICYLDEIKGQIVNMWINEHDAGHPSGCKPLLVMDVFEHAYSVYRKPTERGPYLDDFYSNIDWNVVAARAEGKVPSLETA